MYVAIEYNFRSSVKKSFCANNALFNMNIITVNKNVTFSRGILPPLICFSHDSIVLQFTYQLFSFIAPLFHGENYKIVRFRAFVSVCGQSDGFIYVIKPRKVVVLDWSKDY
jgi:hypothetical protein